MGGVGVGRGVEVVSFSPEEFKGKIVVSARGLRAAQTVGYDYAVIFSNSPLAFSTRSREHAPSAVERTWRI